MDEFLLFSVSQYIITSQISTRIISKNIYKHKVLNHKLLTSDDKWLVVRHFSERHVKKQISFITIMSFSGGSVVKNSLANAGDLGSIPGSRWSLGEGNGNRLQYSCLGNPKDRGVWKATVHGVARVRDQLVTKQQHGNYTFKLLHVWSYKERKLDLLKSDVRTNLFIRVEEC